MATKHTRSLPASSQKPPAGLARVLNSEDNHDSAYISNTTADSGIGVHATEPLSRKPDPLNLPNTELIVPHGPLKTPPVVLPNTVRDHTTDQLAPGGDEYLPRVVDEAGEKKVMPNGCLLGNREYRCKTFLVPNRGDKLFMLAADCAKVLGYRDSYLMFHKNRSLYRIITNQFEKDNLLNQEILPISYRSRQIAIVTARSMFRQFGSRVIANGRRVKDDYWEGKARSQGFTEADLAGGTRPSAFMAREIVNPGDGVHTYDYNLGSNSGEIVDTEPLDQVHGLAGSRPLYPRSMGAPISGLNDDREKDYNPHHGVTGRAHKEFSALSETYDEAHHAADFSRSSSFEIRRSYMQNLWQRTVGQPTTSPVGDSKLQLAHSYIPINHGPTSSVPPAQSQDLLGQGILEGSRQAAEGMAGSTGRRIHTSTLRKAMHYTVQHDPLHVSQEESPTSDRVKGKDSKEIQGPTSHGPTPNEHTGKDSTYTPISRGGIHSYCNSSDEEASTSDPSESTSDETQRRLNSQIVDSIMRSLCAAIDRKVTEFRNRGADSNGQASGSDDQMNINESGSATMTTTEGRGRASNNTTSKRRRGQEKQDDDESDHESSNKRAKEIPRDRREVYTERRFACPYFKRNRRKYRQWTGCPGPGWDEVHRVKCKEPPCAVQQNLTVLDGFTEEQEKRLRSRKRLSPEMTEEQKWNHIYDILFPDDDPILRPSPCAGDEHVGQQLTATSLAAVGGDFWELNSWQETLGVREGHDLTPPGSIPDEHLPDVGALFDFDDALDGTANSLCVLTSRRAPRGARLTTSTLSSTVDAASLRDDQAAVLGGQPPEDGLGILTTAALTPSSLGALPSDLVLDGNAVQYRNKTPTLCTTMPGLLLSSSSPATSSVAAGPAPTDQQQDCHVAILKRLAQLEESLATPPSPGIEMILRAESDTRDLQTAAEPHLLSIPSPLHPKSNQSINTILVETLTDRDFASLSPTRNMADQLVEANHFTASHGDVDMENQTPEHSLGSHDNATPLPNVYPPLVSRCIIVFSLMLATFLSIIGTAIPMITTEFNSMSDAGWYGSAFFLTRATFMSAWGKGYKYFSMKLAYILAVVIFEVGSLVCALAPNSIALICGRAIQGIGAAGPMTGGYTITAFVAPPHTQPIIIGLIGSVFTIASIAGPLLGGAFTS
ncbi:hypothetical protein JX266_011522 [Neoarthrinium moseri]|nr:hypothetical protein JX266_011522 [Neoarthrinium moseri]